MTDDIVERIDEWIKGDDTEWQDELLRDAKAEIERLRKVEEHHDQAVERAERLEAEIDRLRRLIHTMIEEDPNELAADGGVTVLDVWRKEAIRVLEPKP